MSLSSSPFTETSNNNAQLTTEQAQSYHNTNTGTREGYSPSNRTSSSYTGAVSRNLMFLHLLYIYTNIPLIFTVFCRVYPVNYLGK